MDLGLANATAVVAGGGRGMGLATARGLAEEGARVAVLARSRRDVDRVVADLSQRGSPDAVGLVADVRDKGRIDQVFAELAAHWGGELNVLINAVGPTVLGTAESLTDDQWRVAFDDGVLGMVHCVRAALPHLRRAQWARIVNFSASSTRRQSISLAAYTATKAMVTSISKNLSLLLAPDGILVNVVSPGTVVSEGLIGWAQSVGVDSTDPHELMNAVATHYGHPCHLARAGRPDEVGYVATFLASRRNSYMTGADVNVDGGTDFT
jgi:NAD(P)-dependent dehydrogenase (short-subunit alcohol dehydrogenase family)